VLLLLSGACFGAAAQMAPEIFAPGVISTTASEQSPAFSADGNTVYFTRRSGAQSAIMVSHRQGSSWSEPQIAPFSGIWRDIEPTMAPDGSFLVFASNRPERTGDPLLDGAWGGKVYPGRGGNLWKVSRQGAGWGEAMRLPATVNSMTATFAPSIAADGSLYFMRPDVVTGKFRLYRSQFRGGRYEEATLLPFTDGTRGGVDPAVAPDESFLVFSSNREHPDGNDLFIVFQESGRWDEPHNLGTAVNGEGDARNNIEARLGADHHTLYFSNTYVTSVHFPRTPQQAVQDLVRMQSWDNGNENIWFISLGPWLDAHRAAAARSGR